MKQRSAPRTGRGLESRGFTHADLAATALFAFEGAVIAAGAGLDVFGVLVVACVSALGGGTVRDLLIGAVPTASVSDVRYVTVSIVGGVIAFLTFRGVANNELVALVTLDAAGLALFAVVGATKAMDRNLPVLSAALVGTVTAVGGGMMRDVLVGRVPVVLREDVYATSALLGALVVAVGLSRGADRTRVAVAGGICCFALRMVSHHYGWSLPTAH